MLALVPWDYRVEATGRLMPVVQQDIFAPNNGKVVKIFVVDGQRVFVGERLVLLENLELEAQLAIVLGEMEKDLLGYV